MSYGGRLRSRQDIYWPAFVDIFVVLLAVALLIPRSKPPDGPPICSPPNKCIPPEPPADAPPMTPAQYLQMRQSCRLKKALDELGPILPTATAFGASMRVRLPIPPPDREDELSKQTEAIANNLLTAVFSSGKRSAWLNEPISLEITGMTVQFVSGPDRQNATKANADQLYEYIKSSLGSIGEEVDLTWSGSLVPSEQRAEVFISLSTRLTKSATDQALRDREQLIDPCPPSPKS